MRRTLAGSAPPVRRSAAAAPCPRRQAVWSDCPQCRAPRRRHRRWQNATTSSRISFLARSPILPSPCIQGSGSPEPLAGRLSLNSICTPSGTLSSIRGLNIACIDPFSRFRENSGHANFIPMDRSPRYSEKTNLKNCIHRTARVFLPARWRRFRLTGPATLDMTPQVSIDSGLMGLAAGRLALEPRDHIGIHPRDTGLSLFPPGMGIPGVEHGAGLADHQRRHCEIE